MPLLAQQRHRFITGIESHVNHFGAFGNENGAVRIQAVAQLRFGEACIDIEGRMVVRINLYNGHDVGGVSVFGETNLSKKHGIREGNKN